MLKRMMLFLAVSAFLVAQVSAITNVDNCRALSLANEVYNLTQNVTNTSTCFTISAANVTLECNGFTLTGNNSSSYGIYTTQLNSTIRNCIANNFSIGIGFNGAHNGTIYNSTANSSKDHALYLVSSNYNVINRSTGYSAASEKKGICLIWNDHYNIITYSIGLSANDGCYAGSSHNNRFEHSNCSSFGTAQGAAAYDSRNTTFDNITAEAVSGFGIYMLTNSHNSTIFRSRATSGSNMAVALYGSGNFTVSNSNFTGGGSNPAMQIWGAAAANTSIYGNEISANGYVAIKIFESSNNNTIYNNTIRNASLGLLIESTSGGNLFYHNNFTTNVAVFVNNSNSTNLFNTTINGSAQGNYYHNASSYGALDFDGDGYSDTNVTFNSTLLGAQWLGDGSDYRPGAPLNSGPSGTVLITPAEANQGFTLSCNVNASDDFAPSIQISYSVFRSGQLHSSGTANVSNSTPTAVATMPSVAASETWSCSIIISDTYNTSSAQSNTVIVMPAPQYSASSGGGSSSSAQTSPPSSSTPSSPAPASLPPSSLPASTLPESALPSEPNPQAPAPTPESPAPSDEAPPGPLSPPAPYENGQIPPTRAAPVEIMLPPTSKLNQEAEAAITSPSGNSMPNVQVTITSPSGKKFTTTTDATGKVKFYVDEMGDYSVSAEGTSAKTTAKEEPSPPPKTLGQTADGAKTMPEEGATPEDSAGVSYMLAVVSAIIAIIGAAAAYVFVIRKR